MIEVFKVNLTGVGFSYPLLSDGGDGGRDGGGDGGRDGGGAGAGGLTIPAKPNNNNDEDHDDNDDNGT